MDGVQLTWTIPPPRVWMPSSGALGGRSPIAPPPEVRLVRVAAGTNSTSWEIDAHQLRCSVGVAGAAIATLEPPPTGYLLEVAAAARVSVDGFGSAEPAADSNPPLPLPGIMLQAAGWGSGQTMIGSQDCSLTVTCTRAQGDVVQPLVAPLRFPRPSLRWLRPPPRAATPQQLFGAAVEVVDLDAWPPARIVLDNATTCTFALASTQAGATLQNGVATASAGVVTWSGLAIAARAGVDVNGSVSCQLPGMASMAQALPWSMVMSPCGSGTIAVGFTCQPCQSGSYSDGGADAMSCVTCPKGVDCGGGVLQLLPGFFRVDGSSLAAARSSIDADTELYACPNPAACVVDTNTTSRNGSATHFCAPGYAGPLCAVCQGPSDAEPTGFAKSGKLCQRCGPSSANAALTALLALIVAGFVIWVAAFRTVRDRSAGTILFRLFLTYCQTLGTLTSVYIARGTATFRELFGITSAVGDSALTLPPLQCTLRLDYTTRFAMTLGSPIIVAAAAAGISTIAILVNRCRTSTRKRTPLSATPSPVGLKNERHAANSDAVSTVTNPLAAPTRPVDATVASVPSGGEPEPRDPVAATIFMANLFFANITTSCFGALSCMAYRIGGVQYLTGHLDVDCNSSTHTAVKAVAIACLLLFSIGLPAGFITVLSRKSQEQLADRVTFRRLGFLYSGYDAARRLHWWEGVVMMRKMGVVAIGALATDPYTQIFAALVLMTTSLTAQTYFRPYSAALFNTMDVVAHAGILFTVLISLYYMRMDAGLQQCVGKDASFKLEELGVTCGTLRGSQWSTEVGCTFGLLAINLIVVCMFLGALVWSTVSALQRSARAAASAGAQVAGSAAASPLASADRLSIGNRSLRNLLAAPRDAMHRIVLRLPTLAHLPISDREQSRHGSAQPGPATTDMAGAAGSPIAFAHKSAVSGAADIAADGDAAINPMFRPRTVGDAASARAPAAGLKHDAVILAASRFQGGRSRGRAAFGPTRDGSGTGDVAGDGAGAQTIAKLPGP